MKRQPRARSLLGETFAGALDVRVGSCERQPDVPRSVRPIKCAGTDDDAAIGEPGDRLPGVLVSRDPQIEPGFAAINAEARVRQRVAQSIPSSTISLALLHDVRIVLERGNHRLLHRSGEHEPRVFAHGQESGNHLRVTGDERGTVTGEVRLLAQ